MFTTCALLLFSLTGVRGQTNTEYSFGNFGFGPQSVTDGHAFNNNGDPVPILTMDCLAANGYGQWTLSSNMSTAGWYLLENALRVPCTKFVVGDPNHPGCTPPGVVANGSSDLLCGCPDGTDVPVNPK
ncbi:MAG: hypothetical protein ACHQNE_07940, partial [Candidatus Kapaibacterium sp.]